MYNPYNQWQDRFVTQPTATTPVTNLPYQPVQQNWNYISGRTIDNPNNISPNEVPMSGFAVFPMVDESAVYIKRWGPDGTIKTIKYIRESVSDPSAPNDIIASITARLDKLEEKINRQNNRNFKKGATQNE